MALQNNSENAAKIGCYRQVAPLVKLCRGEAGPIAVDAAAHDGSSQNPNDIAMTVIGAAVAVLPESAAEFRQDQDDRLPPCLAAAASEGGEALAQWTQTIG